MHCSWLKVTEMKTFVHLAPRSTILSVMTILSVRVEVITALQSNIVLSVKSDPACFTPLQRKLWQKWLMCNRNNKTLCVNYCEGWWWIADTVKLIKSKVLYSTSLVILHHTMRLIFALVKCVLWEALNQKKSKHLPSSIKFFKRDTTHTSAIKRSDRKERESMFAAL